MKLFCHLVSTSLVMTCLAMGQQGALPVGPAVPRLVDFSGKATDAQGKVITGVAGVTFAIYKDQYEGAPLWMETQNVQADATGKYTAQLGATKSGGLPLELFSTGEARWLGVRVNGGEEQPRVLLLSVPYALKAADAETVGGLPASAFVLAASPNTVSTTSTTQSAAQSQAINPDLTGSGTAGFLPLWTNSSTLGNSSVFQTGTGGAAKVGIGTNSPFTTLDVKGGTTFRGQAQMLATGVATATKGANSFPFALTASAFNSNVGGAVTQNFRWQAEPAGNNTNNASATLNLLANQGAGTTPTETGFKIGLDGQVTFAQGQVFPGTGAGTITGVTAGSGLTGGGTSGSVSLGLLTSCGSGQVLQWNGTTWVCTTPKSGTVTSVGLSAPSSDFTVGGTPVTGSGTLALNWNVAPTNAAIANTIVKRDSTGSFAGTFVSAVNLAAATTDTTAIQGTSTNGQAVVGLSTNSNAVTGQSTTANGVVGFALASNASGVVGNDVAGTGVYGNGGTYGVYGNGLSYGLFGNGGGSGGTGVYGSGSTYGVRGDTFGLDGVHGEAHSPSSAGMGALNDAGGDGIYAAVTNGGFAGFFFGDVDVDGNLSKAAGSFKIDHPLDPANKYLYHSFVESPDMMNIYNGNVTTDASGNAVVRLPAWFENLNRDFRYQLTVIGQFAQAIVGSKMAGNSFTIRTDKPNVEVSWQVTGIRQDVWANAHRIPVEQMKPEREKGSYLHPELFGAPEEKGIAWVRHPEQMKRAKEGKDKATANQSKKSTP